MSIFNVSTYILSPIFVRSGYYEDKIYYHEVAMRKIKGLVVVGVEAKRDEYTGES